MIARLCGCLQITLRKYKISGITGTASLLDEAREMVPDKLKCLECGGAGWTVIATGANGETPEQCQCEWCSATGEGRELLERDETYVADIVLDPDAF